MKKANPRLKKGPDIQDYVVECISAGRKAYQYFTLRADAREYARDMVAEGFDRVRMFRIKYTLISDSKRGGK